MKVSIIKNCDAIWRISCRVVLISAVSLLLTACGGGGGGGDGTAAGSVQLPVDNALTLYCPDEGIAADVCVLSNPDNPFASSLVDDITKWILNNTAPSVKAKFYLWATAMARNHTGENQYYTALNLHQLFTDGGDLDARDQAKKAYRSLLDNYYDDLSYYIGNKPLDLLADVDFRFGEAGSGSSLDGAHTGDTDFNPSFQVIAGPGYGAPTAALGLFNFTAGIITNYNSLTFKIKNLPTTDVYIVLAGGTAPNGDEVSFDLATYATDIPGTTGWKQVTIPLTDPRFPDTNLYTTFTIHGGFNNGGTYLVTDIAFTGDAIGGGLANDGDGDGFVYMYRTNPGTQLFPIILRDLVGRNLFDPGSQGLTQLFFDQAAAVAEMATWGYVYNPGTGTIARL